VRIGSASIVVACTLGCSDTNETPELGSDAPKPSTTTRRDAGLDASGSSFVDAGTRGTADAGTIPDGGSGIGACKGTSSCPVPIVSGAVSGDTGADALSISGATSGWYSIRVTENDSSFTGRKLKLKVTLTSPASSNYDLYLYDDAPANCTTPWQSSTQSSGVDMAAASWGEGSFANGSADDKDVYIEVRHVGGACNAGATWSMQVEGNTN
jgi:hypothetical protein